MRFSRLPYFAVLLLITLQSLAAAQCYFPSGDVAQNHYPCHPYDLTTLCCPRGWTCFSGGICVITDLTDYPSAFSIGASIRGSCTNPHWDETACGSVCLNDSPAWDRGSLTSCGNEQWCCSPDVASGSCDCETGDGTFSLDSGTPQTIIAVPGLVHTSTALPAATTSRYSSSTSFSTLSSDTALTSVTTTTSAFQSTTSPSSASATSSSAAASATDQPKSKPVTQTVAFKAGVGTTAGVVATFVVFALVWFLIVRPKRNSRQTRATTVPDPASMGGVDPYWINPAIPFPHPYASRRGRSTPGQDFASNINLGVPTRPYGRARPTKGSELREQYATPMRRNDIPQAPAPPRYSYESPDDVR